MRKYRFKKDGMRHHNFWFPLFVFTFVNILLLGVGYSALSTSLGITGEVAFRGEADIRIRDYHLKSVSNGAIEEYSPNYGKSVIITAIDLPNIDSTITYEGTIVNIGTLVMFLNSIEEELHNNSNITYSLDGVKVKDLFEGYGTSYTFQITFKYQDSLTTVPENTKLSSRIHFNFSKKESVIMRGAANTTEIFGKSMEKSSIESIEFMDFIELPAEAVDSWDASQDQDGSVIAWIIPSSTEGMYQLYIGGVNGVKANYDSNYTFCYFSNVKKIEFNDNYDTSNVTLMATMFFECKSLTSLDGSAFNTSNVTDMSRMFYNCSSLTGVDLNGFNTSKVKTMANMFYNCSSLTSLDVSSFDTSSVTNMSSMFSGCRSLTGVNLNVFDTSKVATMTSMFYNCSSLTSLDVTSFNTSSVTNMAGMFYNCSNLTSLDVSKFDTVNVSNMTNMFSNCSNLTSLDVSNFNTMNVITMSGMFRSCSSLINLDISNFNTTKVTDMSNMFNYCRMLLNLNISGFDTSSVTDMGNMFYYCSSLKKIDISNFNTTNVTNMGGMFYNCTSLSDLDMSSFDTTNVTSMQFMFQNCGSLTSLDVSNFDTVNVSNMANMFSGCSSLTHLDVSNFNTVNVTNMSNMFNECKNLTTTLTISNAYETSYTNIFAGNAASLNDAQITLNYIDGTEELVDKMISTKSSISNVVKGTLVMNS